MTECVCACAVCLFLFQFHFAMRFIIIGQQGISQRHTPPLFLSAARRLSFQFNRHWWERVILSILHSTLWFASQTRTNKCWFHVAGFCGRLAPPWMSSSFALCVCVGASIWPSWRTFLGSPNTMRRAHIRCALDHPSLLCSVICVSNNEVA